MFLAFGPIVFYKSQCYNKAKIAVVPLWTVIWAFVPKYENFLLEEQADARPAAYPGRKAVQNKNLKRGNYHAETASVFTFEKYCNS